MDIRLCNDEQVVKSWDYATEGKLLDKAIANITVTNKRVISTVQGKKRIRRAEVPVESVKRVSVTSTAQMSLYSIVFMAIGLLLCIGFFLLKQIPLMIAGAIFVVVGIILLFYRKRAFRLSITITPSETVGVSAGKTTEKKVNKTQKTVKGAKSTSSPLLVVIVVLCVYFVYHIINFMSRNSGVTMASIIMMDIILFTIIGLAIAQKRMKKGHKKVKIEKTVSHTKGLKLHFKKEIIEEISNEIGAVVLNAKALKD